MRRLLFALLTLAFLFSHQEETVEVSRGLPAYVMGRKE